MDILLTGYSGNLGTVVCEQLIRAGHKVHVLLHGSVINPQSLKPEVRVVWGSLSDSEVMGSVTKNMDLVIHCAWDGRRTISGLMENVNFIGTKNLIESAERNKVKTFVYISSIAVYGLSRRLWNRTIDENEPLVMEKDSLDSYPWVKVLIEKHLSCVKDTSEMNIIVIRPGLFFSDTKVPAKKLIGSGSCRYGLLVGGGGNHLPFIHVGDVARMIMEVIKNPLKYAVYNCVPTIQLSCSEFLVKWGMSKGIKLKVICLYPFVVRFLNMLIKNIKHVMGKSTFGPSSDYQITSGVRNIYYSARKAVEELNWKDELTRAIAEKKNF